MGDRLILKKVLDVVVDSDYCCDLRYETTNNYLEVCPICKEKNVELEEYGSLETYFKGKRDFCTCSNCKS